MTAKKNHEFKMEVYTTLVCALGLAFGTVLVVVIILAIHLRRRHSRGGPLKNEEILAESEPLAGTPKKPSLSKLNQKRLLDLFGLEAEAQEDDVFEEEATTKFSHINFSLFHIPNDERLVLDVWSVFDTPVDFVTGYIEAQLFPSDFEAGQFRTNVRKSVDNVVIFNESFVIPDVSSEVLTRVYLKLFLYARIGYAQKKCVGHAVFSLREIQWNPLGKTQFKQKLIKHKTNESPPAITDEESSSPSPSREKGELYISLRYQQKSSRINVVVLKAKNIQKAKVLQNDPYVKIKLLYQGEVIDKKQTKSRSPSATPCWNQPFVFNVDEEKGLNNYELIFLLRRRDLISPHSSLGLVRIGAQVGGAGQSHWYAMMAKGNLMRQVARCHKIK